MLKNCLLLFSFFLFFFNCDKKLKIKESSFVEMVLIMFFLLKKIVVVIF